MRQILDFRVLGKCYSDYGVGTGTFYRAVNTDRIANVRKEKICISINRGIITYVVSYYTIQRLPEWLSQLIVCLGRKS